MTKGRMMANQVEVRLFEKEGRDGNPYMIGSSRLPASVKLDEVTFLVFYPEEGSDEATLIIRPNRRIQRTERDQPIPRGER
jgi:hypothetical protein